MGKFDKLEKAISYARFGRYLEWAGNDRDAAFALYALNTRLSESLYTPLQTLEVVLRNRIHSVMCERNGEDWFGSGIVVGPYQQDQIRTAIADLAKANKPASPSGLVASLTFSFWTTMFNKHYEVLWQQVLHRIVDQTAPRGLKRKSFSGPLTRIRLIRNRIAHHEPIVSWNLRKHHGQILELIEWLSPPAAEWCRQHDRFPRVHPPKGILLTEPDFNSPYSLPASASARVESHSAAP